MFHPIGFLKPFKGSNIYFYERRDTTYEEDDEMTGPQPDMQYKYMDAVKLPSEVYWYTTELRKTEKMNIY